MSIQIPFTAQYAVPSESRSAEEQAPYNGVLAASSTIRNGSGYVVARSGTRAQSRRLASQFARVLRTGLTNSSPPLTSNLPPDNTDTYGFAGFTYQPSIDNRPPMITVTGFVNIYNDTLGYTTDVVTVIDGNRLYAGARNIQPTVVNADLYDEMWNAFTSAPVNVGLPNTLQRLQILGRIMGVSPRYRSVTSNSASNIVINVV